MEKTEKYFSWSDSPKETVEFSTKKVVTLGFTEL
jgi:hypothetical protein